MGQHSKSSTIAAALAGFAVVSCLAACGSNNGSNSSSTAMTRSRKTVGAPDAKVSFVTPKEASTVGSTVVARVRLTHFTLAPNKVGQAAKQGEGHLHFSMDQGKFDNPRHSGANGREAVKLGVQGKYSPSVKPVIVYTSLPTGIHELEVYLANNDHSNTGVAAFVSFRVKAGGAAPSVPKGGGSGY